METLKLDSANALKLYPSAPREIKEIFENTWGKDFFSGSITDRIKTFDDILTISGRSIESLQFDGDTDDEFAYKQAKLIAEVYNEGAILNTMDNPRYKNTIAKIQKYNDELIEVQEDRVNNNRLIELSLNTYKCIDIRKI